MSHASTNSPRRPSTKAPARRALSLAAGALLSLCTAGAAFAQNGEPVVPLDFQCVSEFAIQPFVDGDESDWTSDAAPTERVRQLVAGAYEFDWTGPSDASFKLWCRETSNAIFFAVMGRDNTLRGPQAGSRGDRFEIYFDAPDENGRNQRIEMEVPIYPAENRQGTQLVWRNGPQRGQPVPAASAVVMPRNNGAGFFLEFQVPRSALTPQVGIAPIPFAAVQRDIDGDQVQEREVGIATAPFNRSGPTEMGRLERGALQRHLRTLRSSVGAARDEAPILVHYEDVGGTAAREFIAILGGHLVLIGDGLGDFTMASFPVEIFDDQVPISIEFADLNDDGKAEILYTFSFEREDLETGRKTTETIVSILAVDTNSLTLVGSQQTSIEVEGVGRLSTTQNIVDRPGYKILRFAQATGDLSQEEWLRAMGGRTLEYSPLVTRWDDEQHVFYYPMGNEWRSRTE